MDILNHKKQKWKKRHTSIFTFCWKEHQIWSSQSNEHSSRGLPGCDAVYCCDMIPTFRRIMLPPSTGWWRQLVSYHNITRHRNSEDL